MALRFRNVDTNPEDDVETWPFEALSTALDRGLVKDWQPIFAAIRRSPWGPVARRVERCLELREPDGVSVLFRMAIERARHDAEQEERREVAARIREAVERSGLSQASFAEHVGTSPSRLSTYLSGKVTPSASMLLRIDQTATRLAQARSVDDRSE